ncbi:probable protein phosphatase 2C 75, partial [Phalaenopsis equestris]|uniref:probable protein phosphatase 2C 75 n=1 Tax=Phalaenopsis equestris TaxID=78828 RepID=UPI0009E2C8C1
MVDLYVDMSGEDESDNKCRHARRRRIEIRRNVNFAGEASQSVASPHRAGKRLYTNEMDVSGVEKRSPTANTNSHSRAPTGFSFVESSQFSASSSVDDVESPVVGSSSGRKLEMNTPIAFGSVSLTGRAREMEDAVSVRPGFFQFLDGSFPLHFFGVFDGHGGSHVSALCKERMHSLLSEELMRAPEHDKPADTEETRWRSAVERCFVRMDQLALSACACGRVGEPLCRCDRSGIESEIVGSTAVIAVIGG